MSQTKLPKEDKTLETKTPKGKTPEGKTQEGETRMAGDDNMAAYVEYLNNYDRKARGAGSSRGRDRFSGLDIRHVRDARKDFGVSKYDAAEQIIQYARRNEDNTRMGGAAEAELDKLRSLLEGRPKDDTKPKTEEETVTPDPEPTPEPEPETKPAPSPAPSPRPIGDVNQGINYMPPMRGSGGGQTQNINQDNDIFSNVTGDDNTVTNKQGNSIGQYGGAGSWTRAWMKDYFS